MILSSRTAAKLVTISTPEVTMIRDEETSVAELPHVARYLRILRRYRLQLTHPLHRDPNGSGVPAASRTLGSYYL
jgi:hypothetical protein